MYLSALSTFEYRLRFCHRTLLSITFMADRDVFFNAFPDTGAAMPLLGNILELSILFPFIKNWEQVCSCKHSISWIRIFASCVIFYAWRSNTFAILQKQAGAFLMMTETLVNFFNIFLILRSWSSPCRQTNKQRKWTFLVSISRCIFGRIIELGATW